MTDSVWCEFIGGPFDGQTKEIPDLPEYLIPSQMTAEALLAVLEGSRPGAD